MVRVVSFSSGGDIACVRDEHAHEWYSLGEETVDSVTYEDEEYYEDTVPKRTRIVIGVEAYQKGV